MIFNLLVSVIWCLGDWELRFGTGQSGRRHRRVRSMLGDLCSESSPYSYKRVISSSGATSGC